MYFYLFFVSLINSINIFIHNSILALKFNFFFFNKINNLNNNLNNNTNDNNINSNYNDNNIDSNDDNINSNDNNIELNDDNKDYIEGKIISWNIHYFTNIFNKFKLNEIIDLLKRENAQIILLQEFIDNDDNIILKILKKKLNIKYSFFRENYNYYGINYGNLILSKTKILNKKILIYDRWFFNNNNKNLSIKTLIKNKEVWITGIHLDADITITKQEYQLKKLIKFINKNLNNEKHLILGDFNIPNNYINIKNKLNNNNNNYKLLNDKMITFPSNYPLMQLDYIFSNYMDSNYKTYTFNNTYSDHKIIVLEI